MMASRQVASARVCATTGIIGVPVGTQSDVPIIVATGAPPARTRTAPTMNCPVTQGGFGVPVSAQPAMTYWVMSVTTGWALTSTRGNGLTAVAEPAWEHMTVAPKWRIG